MRICSFIPGATEIVYSLGLEDSLFGVSHECDYPVAARSKPHVVRSVFDDGDELSSAEIDRINLGKSGAGTGHLRNRPAGPARGRARPAVDPGDMRGLSHLHSAGCRGHCRSSQET